MGGRIAYFDCFSGISGDMAIAALLDAGARIDPLLKAIESLPIEKPEIKIKKIRSHGIVGTRFTVIEKKQATNRRYSEKKEIISNFLGSDPKKSVALKILTLLAEAESKVHGVEVDDVHFHEIGGVDTIVDILGVVLLLEELGVEEVRASPVPAGSGEVKTAHGVLPVPTPATAELLKDVPLSKVVLEGEVTTPTGAAILKGLSRNFGPMGNLITETVGYGFGHREYERPNFLRVFIGKPVRPEETVVEVKANIDDSIPQTISAAASALFAKGALDVWVEQVIMKKGRPGVVICFLCEEELLDVLISELFLRTSTIGVRYQTVFRRILDRKMEEVQTQYGTVRVKVSGEGRSTKISPEYEDCLKLAEKFGLPIDNVRREAEYKCALKLGMIGKNR